MGVVDAVNRSMPSVRNRRDGRIFSDVDGLRAHGAQLE